MMSNGIKTLEKMDVKETLASMAFDHLEHRDAMLKAKDVVIKELEKMLPPNTTLEEIYNEFNKAKQAAEDNLAAARKLKLEHIRKLNSVEID